MGPTETSQKPLEKKETSTSLVAASEREPAQTGFMEACKRCELRVMGNSTAKLQIAIELKKRLLVESYWKVEP